MVQRHKQWQQQQGNRNNQKDNDAADNNNNNDVNNNDNNKDNDNDNGDINNNDNNNRINNGVDNSNNNNKHNNNNNNNKHNNRNNKSQIISFVVKRDESNINAYWANPLIFDGGANCAQSISTVVESPATLRAYRIRRIPWRHPLTRRIHRIALQHIYLPLKPCWTITTIHLHSRQ